MSSTTINSLSGTGDTVLLDGDHQTMIKFSGRGDIGYQTVSRLLIQMIKSPLHDAPSTTPDFGPYFHPLHDSPKIESHTDNMAPYKTLAPLRTVFIIDDSNSMNGKDGTDKSRWQTLMEGLRHVDRYQALPLGSGSRRCPLSTQ